MGDNFRPEELTHTVDVDWTDVCVFDGRHMTGMLVMFRFRCVCFVCFPMPSPSRMFFNNLWT